MRKLPTGLSDESYKRLAALKPAPTVETVEVATPDASESHRIASLQEIPGDFQRLGAGFYRQGHSIWELRAAEDDSGYVLTRKREEAAVDMRSDYQKTAGMTKTAQAHGYEAEWGRPQELEQELEEVNRLIEEWKKRPGAAWREYLLPIKQGLEKQLSNQRQPGMDREPGEVSEMPRKLHVGSRVAMIHQGQVMPAVVITIGGDGMAEVQPEGLEETIQSPMDELVDLMAGNVGVESEGCPCGCHEHCPCPCHQSAAPSCGAGSMMGEASLGEPAGSDLGGLGGFLASEAVELEPELPAPAASKPMIAIRPKSLESLKQSVEQALGQSAPGMSEPILGGSAIPSVSQPSHTLSENTPLGGQSEGLYPTIEPSSKNAPDVSVSVSVQSPKAAPVAKSDSSPVDDFKSADDSESADEKDDEKDDEKAPPFKSASLLSFDEAFGDIPEMMSRLGQSMYDMFGQYVTPTKAFSPVYMGGTMRVEPGRSYEVLGESKPDKYNDAMYGIPNPVSFEPRIRMQPFGGGDLVFVSPAELKQFEVVSQPEGDIGEETNEGTRAMPGESAPMGKMIPGAGPSILDRAPSNPRSDSGSEDTAVSRRPSNMSGASPLPNDVPNEYKQPEKLRQAPARSAKKQ